VQFSNFPIESLLLKQGDVDFGLENIALIGKLQIQNPKITLSTIFVFNLSPPIQ
jgi:hypothetical protein